MSLDINVECDVATERVLGINALLGLNSFKKYISVSVFAKESCGGVDRHSLPGTLYI
jgi:hypothetical protein